jgi:hypothetical protein
MRGGVLRAVLACLALLTLPLPTAAQPLPNRRNAPPAPLPPLTAGDERQESPWFQEQSLTPGLAFLASAGVPGAGQYLQDADRWFGYVVVEAWAILTYLDQRSEARAFQRRYRDLAWSVARRTSAPPRRDSIFEYYEDMTRFLASGAFDADGGEPGLQPEVDRETFNGELWSLAQALYGDDDAALAYYASRAIVPTYAWAWGDSNLERQVFVEIIRDSDEAFRHATTALGVLVANHMVSAVDALILARLRAAGPGERRIRLRSGLVPGAGGARWSAAVTLHF